jgi:hypothetical protein
MTEKTHVEETGTVEVTMKTTMAASFGTCVEGKKIRLSIKDATPLIEGGYAIPDMESLEIDEFPDLFEIDPDDGFENEQARIEAAAAAEVAADVEQTAAKLSDELAPSTDETETETDETEPETEQAETIGAPVSAPKEAKKKAGK